MNTITNNNININEKTKKQINEVDKTKKLDISRINS